MEDALKDERFAHISKDPRFRSIPKRERKVKIDKRFQSMFTDKRFKLKYTMDKRGRPVHHTTSEDLKKFYELSSESDEEEEGDSGVEATPSDQEQQSDKLSDHASTDKGGKGGDDSKTHAGKIRTATRALKHCSVSDENRDTRDSGQSDSSHLTNKASIPLVRKKQVLKSRTKRGTRERKEPSPRLLENVRNESSSECSDNEENDASEDEHKMDMSFDLARGEGNVESSTTDDSTSESEEEEFDHKWGELDADAPKAEEVTRRLAICNMDWDRIKAQDLFVLLNSFKPPEGIIHSVTIYPSEYGLKRIKEEEVKGPPELVEKTLDSDEEEEEDYDDNNEDGSFYHREKLRQYQLNRLKYYYAVVECDSPETANKLYEELDGMEYESSSACFDLRFISDDMNFDQEAISVANSLPDMSVYKPKLFTTTALQQAKVSLTWDETNPDRIQTIQQAFSNAELAEMDLKAYLASSSSDEDEEKTTVDPDGDDCASVEDQIAKYRKLLLSVEDEDKKKKEKDVEMEITWEPGLKGAVEELVKKKQKGSQTPFEEFLEKRKEKRKKKKRQLQTKEEELPSEQQAFSDDEIPSDVDLNDPYFKEELESMGLKKKKGKNKRQKLLEEQDPQAEAELQLLLMDEDDGKQHFNMKDLIEDNESKSKKKKKRLAKEKETKPVDEFEVDVKDPRFSAVFSSPLYNIDPSDPNFKKTKGMMAFIQEKQKRRAEPVADEDGPSSAKIKKAQQTTEKDNLPSLVKSVKMKTHNFQKKQKKT